MLLVELLVMFRTSFVGTHVEPHVDRPRDGCRIPTDLHAPRVEHLALPLPFRRREIRRVPAICESRRGSKGPFLSRATDPQGQPFLERLRVVRCVDELVMRAVEVCARAIEQQADNLGVFLQLVLALADGWEWNAIRRELDLVPSRPETAIGASVGKVIDRAERLRENAGVPIPDAKDEAADPDLRRLDRGGGQRCDRFEAVDVATLRWRLLEVIRHGEPVEPALVGESPEPSHLGEGTAEVTEMYAEPNTRIPSMGRPTALVRWPACLCRGPGPHCSGSHRRRPRCRRPPARDRRAETRGRARAPSSCR